MKMYLGCIKHCPLCRKQCDIDHKEYEGINDEKHGCQSGHQFQAFGGAKTQDEENALLLSCDELNNDKFIYYKGLKIIYKQFKEQQFQNWIFDSQNQENVKSNREKNVIIWNLIGKDLCKYFNKQGNKIQFHQANLIPQKLYQKTHYIFMLDASPSMFYHGFKKIITYYSNKNSAWESLIYGFEQLLKILEENQIYKENSNISVITYDQSSKIIFEEQIPNSKLIEQIEIVHGKGTNFDNPLKNAYEICKKNQDKYQNIFLYFMSDGDAQYPESGMKNFIDDESIHRKSKFQTVAYGVSANSEILKKMADAFPQKKGQMMQAPTLIDLQNSFLNIIPDIYQS